MASQRNLLVKHGCGISLDGLRNLPLYAELEVIGNRSRVKGVHSDAPVACLLRDGAHQTNLRMLGSDVGVHALSSNDACHTARDDDAAEVGHVRKSVLADQKRAANVYSHHAVKHVFRVLRERRHDASIASVAEQVLPLAEI